jgi:hypothetical protein
MPLVKQLVNRPNQVFKPLLAASAIDFSLVFAVHSHPLNEFINHHE